MRARSFTVLHTRSRRYHVASQFSECDLCNQATPAIFHPRDLRAWNHSSFAAKYLQLPVSLHLKGYCGAMKLKDGASCGIWSWLD
jgi:hypothetical protein